MTLVINSTYMKIFVEVIIYQRDIRIFFFGGNNRQYICDCNCKNQHNLRLFTNLRASQMLPQIQLESLPTMNLLIQSDTTNILVCQLSCLLNIGKNHNKLDTIMHTLLLSQKTNTCKNTRSRR